MGLVGDFQSRKLQLSDQVLDNVPLASMTPDEFQEHLKHMLVEKVSRCRIINLEWHSG